MGSNIAAMAVARALGFQRLGTTWLSASWPALITWTFA